MTKEHSLLFCRSWTHNNEYSYKVLNIIVYRIMGHSLANLQKHIFELSEEKLNWKTACCEWDAILVEHLPNWSQCPCSVRIQQRCLIKNRINGRETYVGNICIKKFTNPHLIYSANALVVQLQKQMMPIC